MQVEQNKAIYILAFAVTCGLFVGIGRCTLNKLAEPSATTAPIEPVAPTAKKDIVGIYLQQSAGSVPGGSFRLEIHSDGRFAVGNMMSAWWGTWERKGDAIKFVTTDSPSGKVEERKVDKMHFDGGDIVKFGEFPNQLVFDRLPPNEGYMIPFDGTSIADGD